MKKIYFENLGCAKNQVDAEIMAFALEKEGYEITFYAKDADIIILNTCAFIESAREEAINTFFNLKKTFTNAEIIVSGCLAQRYSSELGTELPEASAVFSNKQPDLITSVVKNILKDDENRFLKNSDSLSHADLEMSKDASKPFGQKELLEHTKQSEDMEKRGNFYENLHKKPFFSYPGSAFVKISDGCNHFCSYCAIPLIKGTLSSKPQQQILDEIHNLVKNGVKEINLIAQDLASYGSDWDSKSHFAELIRQINNIKEDFTIRLLYLHPDLLTDEILQAVKDCKKVLHYFDIPFQHASEHILKLMGRTGTFESYVSLVDKVRSYFPDAVIRTTIMLGFPTETQHDFDLVCKFLERCHFTWVGSFIYSHEEGTKAFVMTTYKEHKLLVKKAKKRQEELEKIQQVITEKELTKFIGKTYKVLIEEKYKDLDLGVGRIYAQAPEVDTLTLVSSPDLECGKIYDCIITGLNGLDFQAERIPGAENEQDEKH